MRMIELLSQGVIALSTWAWLELHSSSFALLLVTLLAVAMLAVVATALLVTILRLWAAASLPAEHREPAYVLARPRPGAHRPVGGRGPRAPGAASCRLALI